MAQAAEDRFGFCGFGTGLEGGDERAVFALHGDEGRHHGANGKLVHVAAEDSAEERSGEGGEYFVAEVPAHEGGD